MTLYMRDDNLTPCPCGYGCPHDSLSAREPVQVAEPIYTYTFVDYDYLTEQWTGRCTEHGELMRLDRTPDSHNRILIALAGHDELHHDGDGRVHHSAWVV